MTVFDEHVPGETPIDDTSALLVEGITTRGELNIVEAENIRKVFVKYLAAKPSRRLARFDFSWAVRLHKEMFGDVWAWAGVPRTSELNIGVKWRLVQSDLQSLLENLRYWEKHWPDVIQQAAWLHHGAVQIHPFYNGNGRWARMLANIWLKQHDHEPTQWREGTMGAMSPIRHEYLSALKAADQGDKQPLIALHQGYAPQR